jgi:hypothetical protein
MNLMMRPSHHRLFLGTTPRLPDKPAVSRTSRPLLAGESKSSAAAEESRKSHLKIGIFPQWRIEQPSTAQTHHAEQKKKKKKKKSRDSRRRRFLPAGKQNLRISMGG